MKQRDLAKASTAYERAIELGSHFISTLQSLAETHIKAERLSAAETVYRRALDASLEDREYDRALRSIWKLYDDKDQQEKGIAILEKLKLGFDKKGQTKAVLLELLGDAYKEADDTEKQMLSTRIGWQSVKKR